MDEKKREEFCKVCEPLMEWLSDNCHPHMKAIVDYSRAELVEGVVTHVTEEFVKD